jgi:hypothetical protein
MNTLKYLLFESVTNTDEADRLSIKLSQEFGSKNFELVSTSITPEGKVLIGLMHKSQVQDE